MEKYTVEVNIKQVYEVEAESEADAKQQAAQHIIHNGFDTQNVVAQRWGVIGVDKGTWSEEAIDNFQLFGQ